MALAYLVASILPIVAGFCEGLQAASTAPGTVSMRDAIVAYTNALVELCATDGLAFERGESTESGT